MMTMRWRACWLLVAALCARVMTAQGDDLLERILAGQHQAQAKFTTACGNVTETRVSKLMVKPMVLHGKFCAAGTNRFMLDYAPPNPMTIRVNEDTLNITVAGKTQAMDIGSDFRRIQSSFGGTNSLESLKKNFVVAAQESNSGFEMKLVPRTEALKHKLNFLVVKLSKKDYLPRSLEVDGKSGVNSVFIFDITSSNISLPDDTFKVSKAL